MPQQIVTPERMVLLCLETLKLSLSSLIDPFHEWLTSFSKHDPQKQKNIAEALDYLSQTKGINNELAMQWLLKSEENSVEKRFIITYIHKSREQAVLLAEMYNHEYPKDTSDYILYNDDEENLLVTQNDLINVKKLIECDAHTPWYELPYFSSIPFTIKEKDNLTEKQKGLKLKYMDLIDQQTHELQAHSINETCEILDNNDLKLMNGKQNPSREDINQYTQLYSTHAAVEKRFIVNQNIYQNIMTSLHHDLQSIGIPLSPTEENPAENIFSEVHCTVAKISTNFNQTLGILKAKMNHKQTMFSSHEVMLPSIENKKQTPN